jgi:hypothetical protein
VTRKFGEQLREKIASAQTIGRVEMTKAARAQWAAVYSKLSAAQPGLLGARLATTHDFASGAEPSTSPRT